MKYNGKKSPIYKKEIINDWEIHKRIVINITQEDLKAIVGRKLMEEFQNGIYETERYNSPEGTPNPKPPVFWVDWAGWKCIEKEGCICNRQTLFSYHMYRIQWQKKLKRS